MPTVIVPLETPFLVILHLQLFYKTFFPPLPCRCSGWGQSVCSHNSGGGEKCISEVYMDGWDRDYSPVGQRRRNHHCRLQDHHLWWLSGYQPSQTGWCRGVHVYCQQPCQRPNCHTEPHCLLWVCSDRDKWSLLQPLRITAAYLLSTFHCRQNCAELHADCRAFIHKIVAQLLALSYITFLFLML